LNEQNKYNSYLDKIGNLLDDYSGLDLSNISQTWITQPEKIFDRIDCYFNSQQLEKIFEIINNLDKDKYLTEDQTTFAGIQSGLNIRGGLLRDENIPLFN